MKDRVRQWLSDMEVWTRIVVLSEQKSERIGFGSRLIPVRGSIPSPEYKGLFGNFLE